MSTDKYDRQTRYIFWLTNRLWNEGQILICNTRLICFGSDGATTELLKNLVLAGVGYIALVDNKVIDQEDLSENFFVNKDDLGKNRAEICLNNLLELNPDSKGIIYKNNSWEFLKQSSSVANIWHRSIMQ